MKSIEEITEQELFDIADIATGGYFKSEFASERKEAETGGYGKRRMVEWTFIPDDEKNYFEISAEANDRGWHWYAWCLDSEGKKHDVHCLDMSGVVDYCQENNINIRNS